MKQFIFIYIFIINVIGITLMYTDKLRAMRKEWRIPEKVLFAASILGGSIGTWSGMYLFRHKTKHRVFVIGMPLILLVHLVLAAIIIYLSYVR